MSYTILNSDGTTVLTTIADGTADTSATGLTLPGPNYVGYCLALNENLVKLLENFASNVAPQTTNVQGQLWFDKFNQTLNIFTNQGYAPVSGTTVSGTPPLIAKDGDIWFNNNTNQQFLYNAGQFNLVGPQYTKAEGVSGAIPVVVNDGVTTGVTHNILQMQFGNTIIATFSSDLSFVPSPAMPGFPNINQGITLNDTLTNASLNSNLVGNVIGNVIGNLTGNVIATTLVGNLTGNVTGNVISNAIATNILSSTTATSTYLTASTASVGNLTTANAQITGGNIIGDLYGSFVTLQSTNFSTGNAQITAGNVTNLINLSADSYIGSTANITNIVNTNLSTSNAQIISGNITGITNLSTTYEHATNFSTGNAQITAGSITGLTTLSGQSAVFNNLTTANLSINSGNLTLTNLVSTNIITSNLVVTGGSIVGVPVTGSSGQFTTLQATNFSSGNAVITGGYISGVANISSPVASFNSTTTAVLNSTNGNVSTLVATNLSSANTNVTTGHITNFSSGNAVITGGAITGSYGLNAATATYATTAGSASTATSAGTATFATTAGNGGVTSVNGNTGAVTIKGLGFGGEIWHDVTGARSSGTVYTNNNGYPIAVSAGGSAANSGPSLEIIVNGVQVSNFNWQFNGAGAHSGGFTIVPPGATYQLIFNGSGIAFWSELY